ncbi:MAG: hypothetical protein OHK0052_00110 [Anaerolineales bacterium]
MNSLLPNQDQVIQRTLRAVIVLMTLATLLAIGGIFNLLRTGDWQHGLNSAGLWVYVVLLVIAIFLIRRGRMLTAILLVVWGMVGALTMLSITLDGLGIITVLGALVTLSFVITQALEGRALNIALASMTIGVLFLAALDFIPTPYRLPLDGIVRGMAFGGVGSIVLVYTGFLLARFRDLSLRAKFVFIILVATAVPLAIVMLYFTFNTSSILTQNANERLLSTAQLTADELDNFINTTLQTVALEAQVPTFQDYLSKPADERTADERSRVNLLLRALNQRDLTNIISYTLVDRDGLEVASSTTQLFPILNIQGRVAELARRIMLTSVPFVSTVEVSPATGDSSIVFVARILDTLNQPVGALVVRYDADVFQTLINNKTNAAGSESFAVLIDSDYVVLAHALMPGARFHLLSTLGLLPEKRQELRESYRVLNVSEDNLGLGFDEARRQLAQLGGYQTFSAELHTLEGSESMSVERVIAVPLKSRPWMLLFAQTEDVALKPNVVQSRISGALGLGLMLLLAVLASVLAQLFVVPISALTDVARNVTAGNLNMRARIDSSDEIGLLGQAFNSMTQQLSQTLSNLEHRVQERTAELSYQAEQLRVATDVGRIITSLLDTDEILRKVTDLVQQRFDLYYVGLFLVEESGEWAELRAGSGRSGQSMLVRGFRIRIGAGSIIGSGIATGRARVVDDCLAEPDYLAVEDLPETRSEAAIPLRVRGQIIGALSVQSVSVSAFDPVIVDVLQNIADQIAVALDNARLFAESQKALDAARLAYGEISRSAWQNLLSQQEQLGYRYIHGKVAPTSGVWLPEMVEAAQQHKAVLSKDRTLLALPVLVRDELVGVLQLNKRAVGQTWNLEEVDILKELGMQLGQTLESARIYQDAQRQAASDRLVSEIAARMRETLNVERVLRVAVDDIYQAFALEDVTLRLMPRHTDSLRNDPQE